MYINWQGQSRSFFRGVGHAWERRQCLHCLGGRAVPCGFGAPTPGRTSSAGVPARGRATPRYKTNPTDSGLPTTAENLQLRNEAKLGRAPRIAKRTHSRSRFGRRTVAQTRKYETKPKVG